MKRLRVKEWISIDNSAEYITSVPELTNSQTANRYVWNPLHNAVVASLTRCDPAEINLDKIIYLPSQAHECYWSSTPIPQYFTHTYLKAVHISLGRCADVANVKENWMADPSLHELFEFGQWCRVHAPQRPEYLQLQFNSFDLALQPISDPRDRLVPQFVETPEPYQYSYTLNHIFRLTQAQGGWEFPPGYGLKLDYSDIVLCRYRWNNSSVETSTEAMMQLEYDILVDYPAMMAVLKDIRNDLDEGLFAGLAWLETTETSPLKELFATSVGVESCIYPGKNKLTSLPLQLPVNNNIIQIGACVGDHVDRLLLRAGAKKITAWKLKVNGGPSTHPISYLFGSYGPSVLAIASHQHQEKGENHRPIDGLKVFLAPYSKLLNKNKALQLKLKCYNPHETPIWTQGYITVYWVPVDSIPFLPEEQLAILDYCDH